MEPIYRKTYHVPVSAVDCNNRMKMSHILDYIQDVSGDHCAMLGADRKDLMDRRLFWAVIRHRVSVTRLPRSGENVTVETWPMPTTRTAYPRSTVMYDEDGQELMRAISLWVLMDEDSRALVLPGRSGVTVEGYLEGSELTAPGSLVPKSLCNTDSRTVRFTDLDWNGHMNNCRYLDWADDVMPSGFHRDHWVRDFTVCYLSEAREGEKIHLSWELAEDGCLRLDAVRRDADPALGHSRVFSVQVLYG